MMTHRNALPVALTTVALLIAATTCLTVSYAGVDERPTPRGATTAFEQKQSTGVVEHAWLGGHDEEIEEQTELNEAPRRAEEAREETEEEHEEQKSSMGQGLTGEPILRAHLEVINARDAVSGASGAPCVHSVVLPPVGHTIELRVTRRGSDRSADETRSLNEVATVASCASEEGFYRDAGGAPARLTLCPAVCAWTRRAVHGLSVSVLVTGF